MGLDLLGTPASVRIAHVCRRLDGGNELEGKVAQSDNADNGAGNNLPPLGTDGYGADEDVDFFLISD